jgi:hypothetical protein
MDMLASDRIDPTYAGHSVQTIADALHSMSGSKKGEFESTADYNARRLAAFARPLVGNLTVSDTLAFVRPVQSGGKYPRDISYTFDPDTSTLRLFILPGSLPLNGIGSPDYTPGGASARSGLDLFSLETKTDSKRTYTGSNAYGASVTVEETNMSKVGIASKPASFLSFRRESFYLNPPTAFQVSMENSKAARELPALKALLVFKMSEPYLVYDFIRKEPKRDSPTDISMSARYLHGDLMGVIFYSGVTGEIVARLPESFGKPTLVPVQESAPSPATTSSVTTETTPASTK